MNDTTFNPALSSRYETARRNKAFLQQARRIRTEELERTGFAPTLRRVAVLSVYHAAESYYVSNEYLHRMWTHRNCRSQRLRDENSSNCGERNRRLCKLIADYLADGYSLPEAISLTTMRPAPRYYISVKHAMRLLKNRI